MKKTVFHVDTYPESTKPSLVALAPLPVCKSVPLRLVCASTGRTVVVAQGKRLHTSLGGDCHPVWLERMGAGVAFKALARNTVTRGAGGGGRGLFEGAAEWRFI